MVRKLKRNEVVALIIMLTISVCSVSFIPHEVLAEVILTQISPTEGFVGTEVAIEGQIITENGSYEILYDGEVLGEGNAISTDVSDSFIVPDSTLGIHNVILRDVANDTQSPPMNFTVQTNYIIEPISPAEPWQIQEGSNVTILASITGGETNRTHRITTTVKDPAEMITSSPELLLPANSSGSAQIYLDYPIDFDGGNRTTYFVGSYELAQQGIELKRDLPGGITIGLVPEVASAIIKGVRKVVDIPVVFKQTPEMSFFDLMKAVPMYMDAGVSGITLGHCFMTVVPPDIYDSGKTTFPGMNTTTWWTTNGPWHRFACYRNVAMVGKYFSDLDILACGGLVSPEQCIEIMMLGAKGVQISAGIWCNGVSFPGKVVEFMKRYLREQDYKSIREVIGLGQKYIVEMKECQAELKRQIGQIVAQVDYNKCLGTSQCKVCLDLMKSIFLFSSVAL